MNGTLTETKQQCAAGTAKRTDVPLLGNATNEPIRNAVDLVQSLTQSTLTHPRPGYLANRRSASFAIHDDHGRSSGTPTVPLASEASNRAKGPAEPLKRTRSLVKLSLSLDGKAEVTTRTGTTPSPPHPKSTVSGKSMQHSSYSLQRSLSAVESSRRSAIEVSPIPVPRLSRAGRSRDSRTWEFYCDSEARNALIQQAEREVKGSATAAIGLIRSQSNHGKAMMSNPNKRNAHSQKPDVTKRPRADGVKSHKPELGRTVSSVARLQTSTGFLAKQNAVRPGSKHRKSSSQSALFEDFDGDSDKENWVPATQVSQPRRRRPRMSQATARILEESLRVPSQSTMSGGTMGHKTVRSRLTIPKTIASQDQENNDVEVDNEVAAFMGEAAPREEEDLDCVQNLLSLSQAAWQ